MDRYLDLDKLLGIEFVIIHLFHDLDIGLMDEILEHQFVSSQSEKMRSKKQYGDKFFQENGLISAYNRCEDINHFI